jgi:hypothetical protein
VLGKLTKTDAAEPIFELFLASRSNHFDETQRGMLVQTAEKYAIIARRGSNLEKA